MLGASSRTKNGVIGLFVDDQGEAIVIHDSGINVTIGDGGFERLEVAERLGADLATLSLELLHHCARQLFGPRDGTQYDLVWPAEGLHEDEATNNQGRHDGSRDNCRLGT